MHTRIIKFGISTTLIMIIPILFNAEARGEHPGVKRQGYGGGGFGLNFKAPEDDTLVAEKLKSQKILKAYEALEALFRRRLRCERQAGKPGCRVD